MERRVLTDNDIKERKRVLNGNLSEVFEVILEPNNEYWYEKFARYVTPVKTISFDVYEKFASDMGKILKIQHNLVELVIDKTIIGSKRRAVMIKSFLNSQECFKDAHSFLSQYHIDTHEMEEDFSCYQVLTNCYNRKYIISNNTFDMEFLYQEINKALIQQMQILNKQQNIDILMKQLSNVLLLDYLLGNSDRSAKNWGIIYGVGNEIRLTPSFDNTHIFSPEYVHIHGLNITPEALITFLLENRYYEIEETVKCLDIITDQLIADLLLSYEDEFIDVQEIKAFVLGRISKLKEKKNEIIGN